MNKKRIKKNQIFAILGVIFTLGIIAAISQYVIAASDDEFSLTPPSVHVKDGDIENSTLVIGSHLIYVGAMTDELYEIAMDSSSTFSQQDMYYKSELSDGTWYEISSATSIADISSEGTPVPASTIEALEFTHHTKSNGKTYDLVKKKVVNIFNIKDPYDLDQMEELKPIIVQYQLISGKSDQSDMDEDNIERLDAFFAEELEDEQTAIYDQSLDSLQSYYERLNPDGDEADQREITCMVMGKIDATRRSLVLNKVYDLLEQLENEVVDGEEVDTELSSSIIEAQDNIQSTLLECSVKELSDATTIIGKEEYDLISKLITAAEGNSTDCASYIEKIADLYNIRDNIVDKGDKELAYLNKTLIPAGELAYKNALKAGASDKYKELESEGANPTVLDQCLEESKGEMNAVRSEYQFLIDAKVLRLSNADAQQYLKELLNEVDSFRKVIKEDAAFDIANESVDQYKQHLKGKLSEVVNGGTDGSDMSKLQEEKDDLLKQQQKALDDNDMSDYNRLQALIDAKDKEIVKLEKELTDIITSPTTSDADKTVAASGLGSGTAAATALSISEDVVGDIQNGSIDGLGTAIDALDALMDSNSVIVTACLSDIKDALDSATSLDDADKKAADDYKKRLKSLINEGKDKSNQNGLSASEIEKFLEDIMGSSFMGLSDEDQAAAVLAIEWYGEMSNSRKTKELAASYADLMLNHGSRFAYTKYSKRVDEYVSTKALSACIGYRYVFDSARTEVTLQKRSAYYTFRSGSSNAEKESGNDTLSKKAEYQDFVYIPADYVSDTFGYQVEYIDAATVAILYDSNMQEEAQNIFDMLTQKGGS